jgi:uncharacterized RDD family membrane protein YckC
MINPADIDSIYRYFPYIAPLLGYVYFVICEKVKGATMGKALLFLEVRSKNGAYMNWPQSIVRNLTKIYWIPVIFDWLIGRIMNTDRLFGSITRTVVVNSAN